MYSKIEIINIQCIFLCNLCLFIFACFVDDPIDAGLKPVDSSESKKTDKTILINNDNFIEEKEPLISPKRYSSFISKLTFFWLYSFMIKSCKKPLEFNDIYGLDEDIKINNYSTKFNDNFYKEIERIKKINQDSSKNAKLNSLSLIRIVCKTFGSQILWAQLIKFFADIFKNLSPLFLSLMIKSLTNIDSPKWNSGLIAIGLALTSLTSATIFNIFFLRIWKIGIGIKSSFINLIYKKALKMSPKTKRNHNTGEVVNLTVIDANNLCEFAQSMVYIWSCPLQIGISVYVIIYKLI